MGLRAWWHSLKSAGDLLDRMQDIEDEWTDVRLDWADKQSAFDRMLRRMTLRESRRIEPSPEPTQPEIVRPTGSQTPKNELRERARQAGVLK